MSDKPVDIADVLARAELRDGLPVAGYRPQSDDAIALVNGNKEIEERMLRILDHLAGLDSVDKRWLAIGRTQIEQGFMAINRAIFRPARVEMKEAPGVEIGWLIERADSSPAEPLYYFPYTAGEPWTKLHVNALRFARKEDAERVATVLGIKARICEHQWG